MEEVGRKQARNKGKEEASNADLRNAGHEATEKVSTILDCIHESNKLEITRNRSTP